MYTPEEHTFVICAYKENPYLEDCIRSVLAQTVKSCVKVTTSTPNSYISVLADKYHLPLSVNDGIGDQASNFNFAISQAQTALVTVCHQDDLYESDYLKAILGGLAGLKKPIILFTDYYEFRGEKKIYSNTIMRIKRLLLVPIFLFPSSRFWRRLVLSFGDPICCPATTYVKENIEIPVFDSKWKATLDYHAFLELSRMPGSFRFIPQKLLAHRIHEDTGTTETIRDNSRTNEEREIFRQMWPRWFADLLSRVYSLSQKSNADK